MNIEKYKTGIIKLVQQIDSIFIFELIELIKKVKKYKIINIAKAIMKILKINKKIIFLNKPSPEFPILKNKLLKKNLNYKINFSNFNSSLKETVNYWK